MSKCSECKFRQEMLSQGIENLNMPGVMEDCGQCESETKTESLVADILIYHSKNSKTSAKRMFDMVNDLLKNKKGESYDVAGIVESSSKSTNGRLEHLKDILSGGKNMQGDTTKQIKSLRELLGMDDNYKE